MRRSENDGNSVKWGNHDLCAGLDRAEIVRIAPGTAGARKIYVSARRKNITLKGEKRSGAKSRFVRLGNRGMC